MTNRPMSLTDILLTLNDGDSVAEIQEAIRLVACAVSATGNAGKVTIELAFSQNGKSANQLMVKDTVKKTMPLQPKPNTLFFLDDEGNLSRKNPNQLTMERELN